MSEVAAEFIERVAAANIQDARKKISDLVWSRSGMLRLNVGAACALGIAELAACNSVEAIGLAICPTLIKGTSRLGKRAARAKISQKTCPFSPCDGFVGDADAEEVVMHINDRHATSWVECKRMLRRVARLERQASRS